MERTLAIIKPDAVAGGLIGEVLKRILADGLRVVGMRMVQLNRWRAEGFYYVHRSKPFFPTLVDFMSSGPAVVMVLEGDGAIARWRALMGATDPAKAEKGTIRKDYGYSVEKNVVHGSDAPDTASFEISYFFNGLEIFQIDPEKVRRSGTQK
jgi:nucleoside-diphosphate kinase